MKNTVLGFVLCLVSSAVFAANKTHIMEFGVQGSAESVDIKNLNQTLSLKSFDPSLGKLTGVSISLYSQINSLGTIQNLTSNHARAALDIRLSKAWKITTSFGTEHRLGNAFDMIWSGESSKTGTYTLGLNEKFSYSATTKDVAMNSLLFSGDDLAAFTSKPSIDFTFSADVFNIFNNASITGANDFRNKNSAGAWGKVEITYTYDAVNEQNSLALVGLTWLILPLAARRVFSIMA
jgi:hypothetical protein